MAKRGSGSSSRTKRGGPWNVEDFNLVGSPKQIKYAQDLIRREYEKFENAANW